MSHVLVNTLYYCKRKKNDEVLPCAQGCFFLLILFSDCIKLSLSCHVIPLHQDFKICDTKQSITERKSDLQKLHLS